MDENQEFQYPKSFSLKTWLKIWPFARGMGKKLILIAALLVVNAFIDILYPLMLAHVLNNNLAVGSTAGLVPYFILLGSLVLVQVSCVYFFLRHAMFAEFYITKELRQAVFEHLQVLPISYYNQTPVGYILARAVSDTANIGDRLVWGIVDMSWGVGYMIFAIIAMFVLNWKLALIVLALMVVLALLTGWFQQRILVMNRKVRRRNSIMTGAMNEGIVGARTTKSLVLEEQNLAEFMSITGAMKKLSTKIALMRSIFSPLVFFVGSLAVAMVLGMGGAMVTEQVILVGTLSAFINLALGIIHPLTQIAHVLPEFVASQANVERVSAMLEKQPEIVDAPDVVARYGSNFDPKEENWEPLHGEVTFQDVTFRYPDGTVNVLEHFNLIVPAGATVAIVGETGAGKSTLVNLVCRFFEPTGGQVLIDGRDIQSRSQLWLHSHLGYVLQNPHLFSGSVRENIRYGRLNATDAEVEAAARAVSAHQFIEQLEGGWDADVGEGGDRLSTGQKQLLSLARAVLADPRIFVLDEATSSIDTQTEALIQEATMTLLAGRTSFVIAHRLSTIRTADIILVVADGDIIERGTHESLMAARGSYYELFTKQFSTFVPEQKEQ